MAHRIGAALLAVAILCGTAEMAFAEDVGVTLSLSDYEGLRKAKEQSSVTVIDAVKLTGSFHNRDLGISIGGRAFGRREAVSVIGSAGSVRLYGCEGDGIVQRTNDAFTLTPLAEKFLVRCQLASPSNDRLELVTTPSVLWVESTVTDGDLVLTDQSDGSRALSIVRQTAASADVVKLSAAGHYHVTLHPGETTFRYEIDVQNPNRIHQPFAVSLTSGEHVQQVDARVTYDVSGRSYRFDLPPGDSSIILTGTLTGTTFTPPVDASVQYLLLEADPLLRLTVPQAPRRISPRESGMTSSFRGAQAFLVSTGLATSWQVTKLEVLRTTSFAVSNASHRYYVSREGEVVAESTYAINNQGAADLALPMQAKPTFAALDGQPVLLTKNAAGDLWTPLSMGDQSLTVQHRQSLQHRFGLAWGTLWLPQLETPSSQTYLSVAYPKQWLPLIETFRGDARFWSPDEGTLLWFAILSVWTWMTAGALGVRRGRRMLLAVAAGVAALAAPWASALVATGDVIVTALVMWPRVHRFTLGTLFAAATACFVVFLLTTTIFGSSVRGSFAASTSSLAGDVRSPSYGAKSLANFGERTGAGLASSAAKPESGKPEYEGLPARIDIPTGVRSTSFAAELLRTDVPHGVHVVLLSAWIADLAETLLALIALALIAREYRTIREGVRGLWPAPAAQAPAPTPT